ncbi:MAG TPA: hypothetical protein VNY29_18535 [Terriglobales bacterium]|nr:hypothetical protein [Terriglobales bacterium]
MSIAGAASGGQVHDDHTLVIDRQELEVVESAVDNLHLADYADRVGFAEKPAAVTNFMKVVSEQGFDGGEVAALLRRHKFLFEVNQVGLKALAHSRLHG